MGSASRMVCGPEAAPSALTGDARFEDLEAVLVAELTQQDIADATARRANQSPARCATSSVTV